MIFYFSAESHNRGRSRGFFFSVKTHSRELYFSVKTHSLGILFFCKDSSMGILFFCKNTQQGILLFCYSTHHGHSIVLFQHAYVASDPIALLNNTRWNSIVLVSMKREIKIPSKQLVQPHALFCYVVSFRFYVSLVLFCQPVVFL